MEIRRGMSRVVLLTKNYAIKFPVIHDQILFITGLLGNLLEYDRWKVSEGHKALAEVIYCSPLGLFLIMRRYKVLNRRLTSSELCELPFINVDNNGDNMGIKEDGSIVVIDYGGADMHYVKDY